MTYHETQTWQRTLAHREGDLHETGREKLRSGFEQFRSHVEPLAAEIALSVPRYTDHSITHCDSLWGIVDLLVSPDFPLTPAEAFVLGGAFLVHDLGMGASAHSQGILGLTQQPEWLDLLAALYPGDYLNIQARLTDDLATNPTWDGISDPKAKSALTEYLRSHHAEHAERIMSQQWNLTSGQPFYLLEDSELRHWYGDLIGKIARSHWLDCEVLPELFGNLLGAPPKLPTEWTVDPLKVACLLRTADAAQIDARRADPLHTPFRQPQGLSRKHWMFQERMLHPQLADDRLHYTSSSGFLSEEASAWWLAFDAIQMIDGELRKVDALCADYGKPRLAARSVAGADSPSRLAKYIPTQGWVPIDARPVIRDTEGVIERLGGAALYGRSNRSVVLRELLANAVDATRLREAAYSGGRSRPIEVALDTLDNGNFVCEVRDFGVGMNAEEIVEYLCSFGTSGWRSYGTQEQHPGALASGYQATGQFGIGFYSVFMVADKVTVSSRSINDGPSETAILQFNQGLHERPILRKASNRRDRRDEPGTTISVEIRDGIVGLNKFLPDLTYLKNRDRWSTWLANDIRLLALLCEEQIVVSYGAGEPEIATGARSWRDMDAGELYDHLYSPDTTYSQSAECKRWRDNFVTYSRPIYGPDGSVHGRISANVNPQRVHNFSAGTRGRIYCGGFYAQDLRNLGGVIWGEPENAARSIASSSISRDEVKRWFLEQVDLLKDEEVPTADQMKLSHWAIQVGLTLDEYPFLYGPTGQITLTELREMASQLGEIKLVDLFGSPTDYGDGTLAYFDYASDLLLRLEQDMITLPDSPAFDLVGLLPAETLSDRHGLSGLEFASGESILDWWVDQEASLHGEVVRQLASAWGASVADVLKAASFVEIDWDGLNGIELTSVTGTKAQAAGMVFRNPAKK